MFTYSFSHMGIFSLSNFVIDVVIDLLMLGLMGKAIQRVGGNKTVYWLYGLGSLFGGMSTNFFQRPSPYIQPQIGP